MKYLKIWVRLTAAIRLFLVIVWSVMIYWQVDVRGETSIRQAGDFAGSLHEMTMAGLTGMMITGTIGQREVFLDQIKRLSVINLSRTSRNQKSFTAKARRREGRKGIQQIFLTESHDRFN